jgi:uncharacterized membrane protein
MATVAKPPAIPKAKRKSIAPDLYERMLAGGSILLLVAVAAAIARGASQWASVPAMVWVHLATIMLALALTPLLLLQKRGSRRHRQLGWAWAIAMYSTAVASLFVRENNGGFSWIHLLSLLTLVTVPMLVGAARKHKVALHRMAVRCLVTCALLLAGFFTFPFNRMLGRWLLG